MTKTKIGMGLFMNVGLVIGGGASVLACTPNTATPTFASPQVIPDGLTHGETSSATLPPTIGPGCWPAPRTLITNGVNGQALTRHDYGCPAGVCGNTVNVPLNAPGDTARVVAVPDNALSTDPTPPAVQCLPTAFEAVFGATLPAAIIT